MYTISVRAGVSRSNVTDLPCPFPVPHTSIYIYRHAASFVYFTTEKGSKKVLTGYDRVHGTFCPLCTVATPIFLSKTGFSYRFRIESFYAISNAV